MFNNLVIDEKNIISKKNDKIFYKDGKYLVKLFDGSYSTSRILNEALNQSIISSTIAEVPKVYEIKIFGNYTGIVMDYMDGIDLSKCIASDRENLDKYLDIFVDAHHKILSCKATKLQNLYERVYNKIFTSELPMNYKYGMLYKFKNIEADRDIIHGDFILSNVLLDKSNNYCIIDWSHAALGNKMFDIAISYVLFKIDGDDADAEIYLDKICKLENIMKEQVLDMLLLAYVYVVDRYNDEKKEEIYKIIYSMIKEKEV